MKKTETRLPGVYNIEPAVHGDARGYFMETWSTRNFEELGLRYDFVQDNQSYSARKGTLRGIHFQNAPMAQAKLVRVIRGAFDDIMAGGSADGAYVSVVLTDRRVGPRDAEALRAGGADRLFGLTFTVRK